MTTPDPSGGHLAAEDLAVLAEGRAGKSAIAEALAHLATCRSCAAAYVDTVRYRAAWLANPDLFETEPALTHDGVAVAAAQDPAGRRAEARRRRMWQYAAATLAAAAAVVLAIVIAPRAERGPLVAELPPPVAAALEAESGSGLVLPGGEAGAARPVALYRGPRAMAPERLRHVVDSCVRLHETGRRSARLAYTVCAGSVVLGDLDLAADYAREGLARHGDDPALLALAADLEWRANDAAAAESLLRRALRRRPRDPLLRLDLGIVLAERGEHREAERWLRPLAESDAPEPMARRAEKLLVTMPRSRDAR